MPRDLLLHQLTRQGQYLLVMLSEGRPVYVLEEGEEVGVGADGEPVLAGSTPKLVSTFARVELPEWFGPEGRAFADRWNRLRRTPKFHNSLDARHAGLRSLQAAYESLVKQVIEKATAIVEERGVSSEELLALSNAQEEVRAADPRGARNHYKNRLLTREQQRALSGEGPRFRVLEDPLDFEARERRSERRLRAMEEDPGEEKLETVSGEGVSGEGVPLVERILNRATAAARNSKVHGPEHWRRVAVVGLELLREVPDADPFSVLRFALFHDSQRYTDSTDPGHGRRGGAMARELLEEDGVSADRVDLIVDACAKHTAGQVSADPTIGVCWDSDRLNLWRVGSRPSPVLLSTEAARSLERIEWARELQGEPCPSWAEIFEGYDDLRGEVVGRTS